MDIRFFFIFFVLIAFFPSLLKADENETAKTDILFLKIQELESEIAELRNKIESQNYLIEKLIEESLDSSEEDSQQSEFAKSAVINIEDSLLMEQLRSNASIKLGNLL